MKASYYMIGAFVAAAALVAACDDDIPEVVESITLDRALSPTNIKAIQKSWTEEGTQIEFNWDDMAGVSSYSLVIAKDRLFEDIVEQNDGIETNKYLKTFANEDQYYFIRVASETGVGLSKYHQLDSVEVTKFYNKIATIKTSEKSATGVTVNYVDEDGVTHYRVGASGKKVKIDEEMAVSENAFRVDGLKENTQYTVYLYTNKTERGSVTFTTRSTKEIEVATCEEFRHAVDSINNGYCPDGVIILTADIDLESYPIVFNHNLTIVGDEALATRPVLTTSVQWRIGLDNGEVAKMDYLSVKDIDIKANGQYLFNCDANYLFDLGKFDVQNCHIEFTADNGRSLIRTQAANDAEKPQHIKTINIDNCIINNCYNKGQNYALIHLASNTKAGLPETINVANSTFNRLHGLVNFAKVTASSGNESSTINLTNCTFGELSADGHSSLRYFMDLTQSKDLSANTVNINKCVFGRVATTAAADKWTFFRISENTTLEGSGNFIASDNAVVYSVTSGDVVTNYQPLPGVTTLGQTTEELFPGLSTGDFKLGVESASQSGDQRWN